MFNTIEHPKAIIVIIITMHYQKIVPPIHQVVNDVDSGCNEKHVMKHRL